MSVAGIIFSNIHDKNISELTRLRTMASVPFACRYRLVDFTLSNMVNSDITNISVITHYNYHSLIDHIGSGKDWDLARRSGGIKILPPYITAYANNANALYNTRLEALKSMNFSLSHLTEDYVVLSDCDVICNIDLHDIINDHIKNNADITIAVKKVYLTPDTAKDNVIFESDETNRITDISLYPTDVSGYKNINLNIWVMKRKFLQSVVLDAIAHNYSSFNNDIIAKNVSRMNFRVYKYDGYFACIDSFLDYYSHSMELLGNAANRNAIFNVKNRPIYTKVRNSYPTKYSDSCYVKNSMIADGCIIEGTVENSILFRGVKIGKNSRVRNSILFQDTFTGENVEINALIADKNVVIRDGRVLSGHETLPFYIDKGRMI